MKEKTTNTRDYSLKKIAIRTIMVLLLLLLSLGIALSLPVVQTKIAQYFTEKLNKQYGTNIYVDQVEVTLFGNVQLKKVLIKDEKKDTLIYANRLITSILDSKSLLEGNLIFGNLTADQLFVNVKTYKGDYDTNLDKFIDAFDDGKPASGKFLMTSQKMTLNNCRFREIDYNREIPLDVDFTKINAVVSDFKIKGPNVYTNVEAMSFMDHRGLFVDNITTKFTYTKKNILLEKLYLKTAESSLEGSVVLKYDRKDFKDFNNKVVFIISTKNASLSSNDLRHFYNELGKNQQFKLSTTIVGPLNNFTAKQLYLKDSNNTVIAGRVTFKNIFTKKGNGDFSMDGNFTKVSSNYNNLITLLPNVLGKNLPSSLKKIGQFNLRGKTNVTETSVAANVVIQTQLGGVSSKLQITNLKTIDNASYNGTLNLDNFNLGSFLNRSDLGYATLQSKVEGKGFIEKYLDTKISGNIQNFTYNGYNYKNIIADGFIKKPIFKGKINVNDPNLFFDFDGLVDFSNQEKKYDFHAKIDYANLKKLNFIKDSVSVFKGDVVIKIAGNSLDKMKGDIIVSNSSYQNSKDLYFFDYLNLNSKIINEEHLITLNSSKELNGKVQGKFEFSQIQKMFENSLGSLYANYRPHVLKKGQYLKFNFTQFNEIVEILNPNISLSPNAILNGQINGDTNDFKLKFSSNKIDAYTVHADNLKFEVDNKNPLYSTYIQSDSLITKQYKMRDFSLINAKSKDTLSFRTEFKGGEKGNDYFKLNLYHTIDSNNQNIFGFHKSEIMFKDLLWYVNENENNKNKILFDKNLKTFSFDDILVSHENQSMQLQGLLGSSKNKDLKLVFNNVNLNKITPTIEQFKFDGFVDGEVFVKQNNAIYQPTASLEINELKINDQALGKMNLDIKGNEDFSKFEIDSKIENENLKSFTAKGDLEIVANETLMNLDLDFQKFNLGILSNLGGEVLSNIRGYASGNARISGNVNDFDYKGRLFVDDAGLSIPYLNVDYKIKDHSAVEITQNKFIVEKTQIIDSKYNTEGNLQGFIKHKQFGDWELDLAIDSDRILALNTKDHEDVVYYGTAFINGNATIKGPTSGLSINVNAQSGNGTDIKIPINDASSVSENGFIHYLTKGEKYGEKSKQTEFIRDYDGLQMNFEFAIEPNATIEVILNKESKHGMKGKGKGTLNMSINTLGKFEMFGDFQVWEGSYNFKYGGLIDKQFSVKKYGSIVWEGNPYNATLNLEAVSKNITANPAVLIDNASFNKKIPVDVVIGLKGTIMNPEPDFSINFPTVSSVIKSEIETKLGDKDIRQTQALYLLSTGGFLSQEGLSQSQVTNSIYEKAASIFGDIFNNNKDSKMNMEVSYIPADKTALKPTDGRVVANISTQINERITINGKVGVPTGGVSETAIVGNFEMQYRVNEDGTLNLRVFNKENDINYIGQGIGYTQGAGVSYEVDFDTFKELVNKIFKKSKLDREKKEVKDSTSESNKMLPSYINMEDGKSKPQNSTLQNQINKEGTKEEN
ncbi:translocation/assembly module TamB domain-containing protein [Flavobacterium sp.]|uniref:translocation/assembly module TamB domain-containing protein n=1 Tax=Flavobacterium sp. TaxID=239 RepID=UPI0038D0A506